MYKECKIAKSDHFLHQGLFLKSHMPLFQQKRRFFISCGVLFTALWGILFFCDPEGLQKQVFFSDTNDWFMDFYNTVYYSVGKTPYSWGWIPARNYLPFAYLIVYPFSFLYPYNRLEQSSPYLSRYSQLSGISVIFFLLISVGVLFYCLYRVCKGTEAEKLGILMVFFFSGTTLYGLERANQQVLVAGLLAVFLWTYRSNSVGAQQVGFLCLAMAAALKIFPAVFGILLLIDKRYRDTLILIIEGLLFAFLPFLWLNGGIWKNVPLLLAALQAHAKAYAGGSIGITAPTIFCKVFISPVVAWGMAIVALILVCKQATEWKRVLLLTMILIMTSGQQEYYCLTFIFYPIVLFLNEKPQPTDILWIVSFLLIMVPVQYRWNAVWMVINNRTVTNTVCVIIYAALLVDSIMDECCSIGRNRKVRPMFGRESR